MINICRFGKAHYGKPWEEVPTDYLRWMTESVTGYNADIARRELERRTKVTFNFQTLTEEQLTAGTPMIAGDNVGIIGAAGCGKSYIIKQTGNRLLLCPTGISAINAGGQTFHSFFRINPKN
jgi:hypothetical protein